MYLLSWDKPLNFRKIYRLLVIAHPLYRNCTFLPHNAVTQVHSVFFIRKAPGCVWQHVLMKAFNKHALNGWIKNFSSSYGPLSWILNLKDPRKQCNCPPITVIVLGSFCFVALVFSQSKFLGLVPTGMTHELGLQMLSGYYILLESYDHDFH